MGNYSGILGKLHDLCSYCVHATNNEDSRESFAQRKQSIVYLNTWMKSIKKLILQLQDFVAYQDILGPYVSGLIQVINLSMIK